jgi:delta11-fatty-acid desaturase
MLPWEVEVTPQDGYNYVFYTIAFCVIFQMIARQVSLILLGANSPKRGVAARVGAKLVSVLLDLVAVFGGLKELIAPQESIIADPIYGYSSHSQFHFSVAAGYFAWAAVVTAVYKGSKIAILHHTICCLVYMFALSPFLHHVGNLYLIFQASTLVLDTYGCGKLLTSSSTKTNRTLKYLHPIVFWFVRIVVGVPMSVIFLRDMINLLVSGEAHDPKIVVFFMAVNVTINVLNIYWAVGMALGLHSGKPACSVGEAPRQDATMFDIGFSISFGERKEGAHQRKTPVKVLSSAASSPDLTFSTPVAIVALASVIAKNINLGALTNPSNWADEVRSMDVSPLKAPIAVTLSVYLFFKLFSIFGAKIFDEATGPCKKTDSDHHLYTRIRGIWYDLAKFEHPGGPVAVNLAKNRDATALFESHHYLITHEKLYATLNKYKVSDDLQKSLTTFDKRDDGAHYVWDKYEEDPFMLDIKKMVIDHFKPIAKARGITLREATKATPQRWTMILSMMAMFFATLPAFVRGEWWTLVVTPQLAWVIIANYWHDGLHFSLSTDWRINAALPYLFPWLSSPWMWYHQHVIGHHAYTNVGKYDPDLAHAPQLMREHESIKWRPAHKHQHGWNFYLVWSVAVGAGMQILSDVRANLKGSYNNVVPFAKLEPARLYAHTLGRLFYVFTLFVWPYMAFPFWKAFIWATVPIVSFSWSFMLNSQINHLTEATAHASDTNFLKHQVVTAQDFGVGKRWHSWFSGGLNQQIEHHMFPCVNHCHLPALAPKVEAICIKHGVKYNKVSGYREAFKTHVKHTARMGLRPFSDDDDHE